MENEHQPNISKLKTYVYYQSRAFFVSTIERNYDTCAGSSRGLETLVWEIDPVSLERGKWIFQGGGLNNHFRVCRELVNSGVIKNEEE